MKYDRITADNKYEYGKKFGDDLCYDSNAVLTFDDVKGDYPVAPANAVWVAHDKKYYKVVADPDDIFANLDTKNIVQSKENNRFYEVRK